MQYSWVKKSEADSLIIFYSGWGMTEGSVALDAGKNDLLVFFDYRDVHMPEHLRDVIKSYKTIFVVAWSLGIVPAVLNKHLFKVAKFVAVNGSIFPSDDRYGIPEAIYQGTHDNLDKKNLDRFYKRMFEDTSQHERFKQMHAEVEIGHLKEELLVIKDLSKTISIEDKNIFDRVILSTKDKIFPLINLQELWSSHALLENSHYPFFDFKDWSEILNV